MNLGENIYRFRTERNMSQGDLADTLEVSRQSVSKWENHSAVPELEKLIKMSELFGVTLDQLVGKEAFNPPPHATAPETVIQDSAPPYRTIGVIVLCFGLLVTLLLSILGSFLFGVMVGLPFTIVGSVLISSAEGTVFKSAWALFAIYAPLIYYFTLNFVGIGPYIRCGVLLGWLIVLSIVSICLHRSGKLSDDSKSAVPSSSLWSCLSSWESQTHGYIAAPDCRSFRKP